MEEINAKEEEGIKGNCTTVIMIQSSLNTPSAHLPGDSNDKSFWRRNEKELVVQEACVVVMLCLLLLIVNHRPLPLVPHDNKWSRTVLKWKLEDPLNLLKAYDKFIVRSTLHRAFSDWSSASKKILEFQEIKEEEVEPDITVLFALGDHNDSLPFDGKDGIVAHGFYPTEGKLHFDGAEKWTLNLPDGINLYQTAMHEIGHLLGLKHSTDYRAVMYPINRPYDPNYRLEDDDIRGIRYLYTPWAWTNFLNRYLTRLWENVSVQS